ncbi:MAG: hypothetical protein AABZ25_08345 [Nitrospirota bacterium]
MKTVVRHKIRKHKIPRGLDPAIVENILWFSRFTPIEKIRYCEEQEKWVKWVRTLKPREKADAI